MSHIFGLHRGRRLGAALLMAIGAIFVPWTPAAAAGLTLNELMHETVTQNHDLKAARAQIDAAIGRLTQSGLWPNPRLQLSNETGGPFNSDGGYARSLSFSQDFPIAGRLGRAQDVARVDVARALAEVNEAERKLLGNVATTYYAIVAFDQKLAARDHLIAIETALVQAASERYKAGEVSELDVNSAKLELEQLRQDRAMLALDRMAALKNLATLAGLTPGTPLVIDTALPSFDALPSLEKLTAQALATRPDLRLLSLSSDRARAEQMLARASAWEDWTVSLGVREDRLSIYGAPTQPSDKALMMTLTIPLPLFNQNQGAQTAAVADKLTADEKSAALRQRIENEVAIAYERARGLLAAVRRYDDSALRLGRQNAALARDAYRSGQLPMTEVTQTSRQEIDLNTRYIDTISQYRAAIADLNTSAMSYASFMTHPEEISAIQSGAR